MFNSVIVKKSLYNMLYKSKESKWKLNSTRWTGLVIHAE